jgi:hypothetical protein
MRWLILLMAVLVCVQGEARAQIWESVPGAWGALQPDMAMDHQGNVHVAYTTDYWDVRYVRYDISTGSWGDVVVLPASTSMCELFGRPKVGVGPNGVPHIVWADMVYQPFTHPGHLMHAWATSPEGTTWTAECLDPDWVASPDVVVDDDNNTHFVFQRVTLNPDTWYLIYRDRPGNETVIQVGTQEAWKPNFPAIEWGGGLVHVAWEKADGDRGNIYYTNSADWSSIQQLTSTPASWHPTYPHMAWSAQASRPGVVFYLDDWSSGTGYHQGVYYSEPGGAFQVRLWSCNARMWEPRTAWNDDWYPQVGFDQEGERYVVWTVYDDGKTYYRVSSEDVIELAGAGHIGVAAGVNGGALTRCNPTGGQLYWTGLNGGFLPPTAEIDSIVPSVAYQPADTVAFNGSASDNDEEGESIETLQWLSQRDGLLSTLEDFTLPAESLSVGAHLITLRVWDDEGQTAQDTTTIVVNPPPTLPPTAVIDSIWPSPAMQQRDTVYFRGSAWDNDVTDTILTFQWWSQGQVLSTQEDFDLPADSLPAGLNAVRFTAWDDEADSAETWGSVTIVEFTPVPAAPEQVECVYEPQEHRVRLSWVGPQVATFNVYYDSTAYFTLADPIASGVSGPPWYHDDPDLTRHHFYAVTSENIGGESPPSERVGLVPFGLVP